MLVELKTKYKNKSWKNGDILVINADFNDFELPENCLDVVFQDPPYKFEAHGRGIAKYRQRTFDKTMKGIGTDTDTEIYTDSFFSKINSICKNINYFHFCNKAQLKDLIDYSYKQGYCFDIIPICKTNPTPFANNAWLMDREWGVHIHKGFQPHSENYYRRGWFETNNSHSAKIDHPTPKNLEICKRIIINISKENDIIFDGFLGSGTTAIACLKTARKCIAIEKNEKYFNLACERIDKAYNQMDMFNE